MHIFIGNWVGRDWRFLNFGLTNKFVAQLIDKVEKSSKDFKSMVEGLVQDGSKEQPKSKEEIIAQKEQEIEELKRQIKDLELKSEVKEDDKVSKKNLKAS